MGSKCNCSVENRNDDVQFECNVDETKKPKYNENSEREFRERVVSSHCNGIEMESEFRLDGDEDNSDFVNFTRQVPVPVPCSTKLSTNINQCHLGHFPVQNGRHIMSRCPMRGILASKQGSAGQWTEEISKLVLFSVFFVHFFRDSIGLGQWTKYPKSGEMSNFASRSCVVHVYKAFYEARTFDIGHWTVSGRVFTLFTTLLCICLLEFTFPVSCQSLIVSTEHGRIRGILGTSRDGRSYSSFLGIPYAAPPEGRLRFEPPQPPEGWTGILSTSQYGSECLQMDVIITGRLIGSEDCLYLNVFTPWILQRGQRKLLPVMVFIHGGFFMSGGANMYRGKYFMDQDVVLVTLNYRLGAFGFLNIGGESNITGNMGLKDQTLALKWIQTNIHKFGGDPDQVTIFGESVGGASVQYHMISPLSKGLFHKGISQSGTAARNYMLTEDSAGQAKHLANRIGCPVNDLKRMGDCFRSTDAMQIVSVHKEAISPERRHFAFYGPTIEEEHEGAFFTRDPRQIYKSGNFTKMPWISGVDSGEGLFYVAQILREGGMLSDIESNWDFYLPKLLNYNGTKHPKAAQKIRQYYFGQNSDYGLRIKKNIQNFTNMFSDRMFFLPQKEGAQLSSQYAPTFMYYFTYETPISIFDLILGMNPYNGILQEVEFAAYMTRRWLQQNIFGPRPKFFGSSHGDELSILFDTHILSEIRRNSVHYKFSKEMVKLWADFARDESSMKFFGTKWPPMHANDSTPLYLELNKKGRLIYEPFKDRMDFWTGLNLGSYLYS